MAETLEQIEVSEIELRQTRSALYQIIVRTNDRDNSYIQGTKGRREAEEELKENDLFDSMNAMSIFTERLNAIEIVEAAKIIKKYFDEMNRRIEMINAAAGREKTMLKTTIETIFGKEVE